MQRERVKKIAIALSVYSFAEMVFDEEDDEEIEENKCNDAIMNFAEIVVPRMTDQQFRLHFRLKPQTFEDLLKMLHAVGKHSTGPGRPTILLEKEALIMLWYLANMESFRCVANRFGITKSTCWRALYRMCSLTLEVNRVQKIIRWPSVREAPLVKNDFFQRGGIPRVLGAIDGSHIPIVAPKEHHNSYINRKGYHSVLLQGVCDSRLCFIDVYAGQPGSIHDWTLFKKSDLSQRILANDVAFPEDAHLIGDLAYPLREYLLVGFKDYANLTRRQKNFNIVLSKTRVVIENAFGLLKGRFRRLKSLENIRLDLIPQLIVTACILHNLCLFSNDTLRDLLNIEAEAEEERRNNPHNIYEQHHDRRDNIALMKRQAIMNQLPMNN